jgi:pimeloyl-ACP methyl ester carboxylesterase
MQLRHTIQRATRIDQATGIQEIAEFFESDSVNMFGFTHLPASTVNGCVVVCSPLYAEYVRNYRREVVIGRRLAALGIAVQRFHYRGHGNSEGDTDHATFDTMRDDAMVAAERVIALTGTDRIAFFGTRFGSLIAASAAARFEGSPLVLWDPVLVASQYLRDVFRARRMQALNQGDAGGGGTDGLLEQLKLTGSAQVLGYTITRALYKSGLERTLENELGKASRRIFVLSLGNDPRLDRGLAELVPRWKREGLGVESRSIGQREAWWFTSGSAAKMEALTQVSDLTVDWLARSFEGAQDRS